MFMMEFQEFFEFIQSSLCSTLADSALQVHCRLPQLSNKRPPFCLVGTPSSRNTLRVGPLVATCWLFLSGLISFHSARAQIIIQKHTEDNPYVYLSNSFSPQSFSLCYSALRILPALPELLPPNYDFSSKLFLCYNSQGNSQKKTRVFYSLPYLFSLSLRVHSFTIYCLMSGVICFSFSMLFSWLQGRKSNSHSIMAEVEKLHTLQYV